MGVGGGFDEAPTPILKALHHGHHPYGNRPGTEVHPAVDENEDSSSFTDSERDFENIPHPHESQLNITTFR